MGELDRCGYHSAVAERADVLLGSDHCPSVFASWSALGSPDPIVIGGKAAGLLTVPGDWTPDFVVLGRCFRALWEGRGAAELLRVDRRASELIDQLILRARQSERVDGIMVRSNSPAEMMNRRRGAFRSLSVPVDRERVVAAIDEVLAQDGPGDEPVFAVVQLHAHVQARGHLSNERRVSERASYWLVEEDDRADLRQRPRPLKARAAGDIRLDARNRREVFGCLRHAAHRLRGGRDRVHCEWVWDGARVWIVQRDAMPGEPSPVTARYLRSTEAVAEPDPMPALRCIRPLPDAESTRWSKVSKPMVFKTLGMPAAPVFFLSGADFLRDARGAGSIVREDLVELVAARAPLVIRCDLLRECRRSDLSLPTSNPSSNPDELLGFMAGVSEKFDRDGLDPESWALLPAWLVPARASVMVHARPGGQLMHLDALWGFPDGVGLLPHDTYFHRVDTENIESAVRFKGSCLLWSEEEGWTFRSVPSPFDWRAVLDESEMRTASRWAQRLSDHLQHEVQLMALARIGGQRGPGAMLPWHYTNLAVQRPSISHVRAAPLVSVATVRAAADLESSALADARGIDLRPSVEHRRDPAFMSAIGRLAADRGIPVYFEGSVLGHAYYQLREAGAEVVPVGLADPDVVTDEYNKIVRDRMPEIIRLGGATLRFSRASPDMAVELLKQKLVEEAVEVSASEGEGLIGELADLAEVIQALCSRTGVSPEEIEALRRAKQRSRGGFEELFYLEATSPDAATARSRSDEGSPLAGATSMATLRVPGPPAGGPLKVEREDTGRVVFTVPVVAPLERGIPLKDLGTQVGDFSIRFRYVGRHIEIAVERVREQRGAGQLSLPVELR